MLVEIQQLWRSQIWSSLFFFFLIISFFKGRVFMMFLFRVRTQPQWNVTCTTFVFSYLPNGISKRCLILRAGSVWWGQRTPMLQMPYTHSAYWLQSSSLNQRKEQCLLSWFLFWVKSLHVSRTSNTEVSAFIHFSRSVHQHRCIYIFYQLFGFYSSIVCFSVYTYRKGKRKRY